MSILLLTGDCRKVLRKHGPFDLIFADPPYGDTKLDWDKKVRGWEKVARALLKPTGSMWVFGSMRYFLDEGTPAGFQLAQDVVWEKHNGSGFADDRFRRVHEHAVQFYRDDAPWKGVYNDVQRQPGEARTSGIRRNNPPAHTGRIGSASYEYGDSRIMRSVITMRSMHGRAIHDTEKPAPLLEILCRTSCPPDGLVGDFFAGSAAAAEACALTGRNYVGAEIDGDHAAAARARLDSHLFTARSVCA